MVSCRDQAWVTCVTRENAVTPSLILAESLRKAGTTRKIAAIISGTLARDTQLLLQTAFDYVFQIADIFPSAILDDKLKAQCSAFRLTVYKKCVFIAPNCFALENPDRMFDEVWDLVRDYTGTWDVFGFTPCQKFFNFLCQSPECENYNGNDFTLRKAIQLWLEILEPNADTSIMGTNSGNELPLWKLSLENGRLVNIQGTVGCAPWIVIFTNAYEPQEPENEEFARKLISIRENKTTGLIEKKILQVWFNILGNPVKKIVSQRDKFVVNMQLGKGKVFSNEPIAIIGIGCRFPGANNLEEFWDLLYAGKDAISVPPTFRWTKEHTNCSNPRKWKKTEAGFLKEPVDQFDSKFFGISPKEAEIMDPQARLLHEVMWESLENAGIDPHSLYGSHTGIFTGSWLANYRDLIGDSRESDFIRTYMGNSIGGTAARLSFFLGATGPSIATESGCSSAMVAVDLAVKSLRLGETNLALAAGVNLLLHPFDQSMISHVLSSNGRCKTFDEKADGFGRAEGCGVLVLKRLSDAFRDGDYIWALIRGTGLSQEGPSRSLGTPTVHSEALAMELALKDAGVSPEHVSYVEAHGTGTSVGDPMEVMAISKVYYCKARRQPLVIGSVKTNVGHTESCSGITGIIKTVLSLKHELIPAHLNLIKINPELQLDRIPAVIPLEPFPWSRVKGGVRRMAGVSSFGITGTDAHVILEEAPDCKLPKFFTELERPLHLIKISGKSEDALDKLLLAYGEKFMAHHENVTTFADAAYTVNVGRASFEHRAFLLAHNFQDAASILKANKAFRGNVSLAGAGRKLCFLFPGQGSQYPGMGKILYENCPIFRVHFDQCDLVLRENYNLSICPVLWEPVSKDEVSRTIYSQTSIFVIEYCLLKLWESWGVKPEYVLGHSLGEFCAAVAAGILDFKDALKLVTERSRLIDNLPGGSMLVVRASYSQVKNLMQQKNICLDFAAVNSDEQTVVAGDTDKIKLFLEVCKVEGLKSTILDATHAFHSRHMDSMLEQYRRAAENLKPPKKLVCQFISGMEGKLLENPAVQINADYWVRHTREKVAFLEACKALQEFGCVDYVEVGGHPVLSSSVMQNNAEFPSVTCYPSLRRTTNDWETLLTSLGKLYLKGYKINWEGYDKPYQRTKMPNLPTHPFNRKSYWVTCHVANKTVIHPLVGHSIPNATREKVFENDVTTKLLPYLMDHCIGHMIIFPGACFTEMCLVGGICSINSLGRDLEKPTQAIAVENVKIESPLELMEDKPCRVQTVVSYNAGKGFECRVYHRNHQAGVEDRFVSSHNWVLHATAKFLPIVGVSRLLEKWNGGLTSCIISSAQPVSGLDFYKNLNASGLKFGKKFQTIQQFWTVDGKNKADSGIIAEMKCPLENEKYILHPLVIDTMMQTAVLSDINGQLEKGVKFQVPVRIGKLTVLRRIEKDDSKLYCHAKKNVQGKTTVFACTSKFALIALMEDLELIETTVKSIQSVLLQQASKIPESWEENWKPIPGPLDSRVALGCFSLDKLFSAQQFLENWQEAQKSLDLSDNAAVASCIKINRLVYLYTLKAFTQLGWKPNAGDKLEVDSFCSKYGIRPNFKQLMYYHFSMFESYSDVILVSRNDEQFGGPVWRIDFVNPDFMHVVDKEMERLYQDVRQTEQFAVVVDIYKNVSNHLTQILQGNVSPLSLLFPLETDPKYQELRKLSAEAYYLYYPGAQAMISKLSVILREAISQHKERNGVGNKTYRILEVGAGTGSLSTTVLKIFSSFWGPNFEYYYTDISASFILKAEKRGFSGICKNALKFATFNIEESPLEQDIPANYFDIVLAFNVLHATKDLKDCLRNIRQTMRPQAHLLFIDTFSSKIDRGITFVFGLLEGYWRFEDFSVRQDHCCVDGRTWKRLLLESGFDDVWVSDLFCGVMGGVTAVASPVHGWTLQSVSKSVVNVQLQQKKFWLLFFPENDPLGEALAKVIGQSGGSNVRILFPNAEFTKSEKLMKDWINELLADRNVHGIVYAWGKQDNGKRNQKEICLAFLYIAKRLLKMEKPPKLCVLTRRVHGIMENSVDLNPSGATLNGMAKSLKNEQASLFVRCIDLDDGNGAEAVATEIDQILYELTLTKEARDRDRIQVAYRENIRYEPRFSRGTLGQNASKMDLELPLCSDRYQLMCPKTRVIDDLLWVPLEPKPLGRNEVEVKIKAYSLNFRDIFSILKPDKQFENYNNVGVDFAGVITQVGPCVPPEIAKVGNRVFGIKYEETAMPSHLVVNVEAVQKLPDGMTFSEGSTLAVVFGTAIHCLQNVGKIKKDDWVLIHTGSGGVGLAAIHLVKLVGANLITTAGNPRKRAYLRSLGIKHVFHSRDTSFLNEVLKLTNGSGVNLVLNSLTGPGMKQTTLKACGKYARFIEMSKLNIWTVEEVANLRPDVTYRVVDLGSFSPVEQVKLIKNVKRFLDEGYYKSIPYTTYDALRIRQALKFFQKGSHIGKLVINFPEQKAVAGQWTINICLFNAESTYIITGGLGGIGLVVCKWMLERGATDIVLVGRNPPKPEAAAEIEQMNKNGYNVMIRLTDVGDDTQCKQLIENIKNTCKKPIRGIQHCAGVLRDNSYENQKWADFEATFNPKVKGTWNLHNFTQGLLLEHFVVHSSISALMGSPGQPNHTAANSFEDAFIHYRHALGLPGISINWGQWGQVGIAKEMNVIGLLPVRYERMLNGLEESLRSQYRQVAIGDFDGLQLWISACPAIKYFMDDSILKGLQGNKGIMGCSKRSTEEFWQEMDQVESKMEKINVVINCIKSILRDSLRLDGNDTMNQDTNLNDMGVDSLMIIELRNSIQCLLGSRLCVTANMLKECQTIGDLSNVIVNRLYEENAELGFEQQLAPEELAKLLENDIILEEGVQPPTKPEEISKMRTVLITGCTGQVGPYLLSALSNTAPTLEKIIIVVRVKTGEDPNEKLKNMLKTTNLLHQVDMDKVRCISGNATFPKFGLKLKDYDKLANTVDSVIHLAVKSNHVQMYRKSKKDFHGTDVRSVNVGGLLNVLRFASTGKTKHVYYPSSWSCAFMAKADNNKLSESWPCQSQIKSLTENNMLGYVISKWVCEMLLKQALDRGIPCKVFRFAYLLGDSHTGQLLYRRNHYVLRLLSYMKIKAMPAFPMPVFALPVDIGVRTSVSLFCGKDVPGDIYNIIHPHPDLECDFVKVAKRDFGVNIVCVSNYQSKDLWEKLSGSGMPLESLRDIYLAEGIASTLNFPGFVDYQKHPNAFFESKKLKMLLPQFFDTIPSSMDIISKSLIYVKGQGFFEKFGI